MPWGSPNRPHGEDRSEILTAERRRSGENKDVIVTCYTCSLPVSAARCGNVDDKLIANIKKSDACPVHIIKETEFRASL